MREISGKSLPPLRQDLELLPGPPLPDGAASWLVRDPVRNRYFEIGELEALLLARWEADASPDALAAAAAQRLGAPVTEEDVVRLAEFLGAHQLLSPQSEAVRVALLDRVRRSRQGAAARLLHNYLFFRVPLWRPGAGLDALARACAPLFRRRILAMLLLGALLGAHLVQRQWSAFAYGVRDVFSPDGILLLALAATGAKVLHELGHAVTARRLGVEVPTIGVAFLVMWPLLYTDTSDSWRLSDRRDRLTIACAGIACELALAVVATLLWALLPDGALRTACFYVAFVTWIVTLAINVSPFMRFDGYFILSDAIGMPNLHERSFALARRWMRQTFFSLEEPDPEPALGARARRWMIGFALLTWVYRLAVFIGIALIVYHAFFKVLGLFLMAVEIAWFVLRPIGNEMAVLWSRRRSLRPRWSAIGVLVSTGLGVAVLALLVGSVRAPALMRAAEQHEVLAPAAGRLSADLPESGRPVTAGTLLAVLEAPDGALREQRAGIRGEALRSELMRSAADDRLRDRSVAIRAELASADASARAAASEARVLELRAPHDGIVRDVGPGLVAGRWVRSRELLMRVVDPRSATIEAYVSQTQARTLASGDAATFYPDDPGRPVVTGRIVGVDETPIRIVPSPMLASPVGGPLPATRGARGEWLLQEPLYRVRIAPDAPVSVEAVTPGTVRARGDWLQALRALPARAIAVVVRESGF